MIPGRFDAALSLSSRTLRTALFARLHRLGARENPLHPRGGAKGLGKRHLQASDAGASLQDALALVGDASGGLARAHSLLRVLPPALFPRAGTLRKAFPLRCGGDDGPCDGGDFRQQRAARRPDRRGESRSGRHADDFASDRLQRPPSLDACDRVGRIRARGRQARHAADPQVALQGRQKPGRARDSLRHGLGTHGLAAPQGRGSDRGTCRGEHDAHVSSRGGDGACTPQLLRVFAQGLGRHFREDRRAALLRLGALPSDGARRARNQRDGSSLGASRRDQRLSHGERIRGGGGRGEQRDLPFDASFRRGRPLSISFPMGNQNPRDFLSRSA